MTEAEVLGLAARLEADNVERTLSLTDTKKFCEAICAFANDLPSRGTGYLLIGVSNAGEVGGLSIEDAFLASLGDHRSNGKILPLPVLTVERVATAKGDVAVVAVPPSSQPPVRYDGRIHIRIGPRRAIATEQEERLLTERRTSKALTFDSQPCAGSSADDLAQGLFRNEYLPQAVARDILEENNRSLEQQLASLRFYDLKAGTPTHAGILAFGFSPRDFLPGAAIQFLRVNGTTLADDIVNERELQGDLISSLRELDALVDAHLVQYPVPSTTLAERTVEAFPRVAVRELLMNAICHRDYQAPAPVRLIWFDDRIEIQSPGGLYGAASPENFPKQTSYRNPVVAEVLKNLGYVNRYGRGVYRAQDSLEKNGSRPAEFVFDLAFVLATIWRRA